MPKYRFKWMPAADRIVDRGSRYVSYISTACLLVVCLLAFVNVFTNKLFTYTIPNQYELIEYLLVPIVYFSVPNVQLTRGLTNVDFLMNHLPHWFKRAISYFSCLVGAGVYSFAAYRGYYLLLKFMKNREMSSSSARAFALWPFVLLYIIGTIFLVLAFLWSILRLIAAENHPKHEEKEA